ncbi:hypothetical protein M3Y99_01584200 [Aphelenchoides fujianensis]|nr:hypothetical protein M3Y99_01584200 [Aphelenchoides fujianensis]
MRRAVVFVGLALCGLLLGVEGQRKFASKDDIQDAEHMKQHLKTKIDVEKLDEQKQKFHYFKLHDSNKDGALDGLEIMKALTHNHDDEKDVKPRDVMEDGELERLVDAVLKEMDVNEDGRVDFAEYLKKAF